jgi:hypothetical protein
MHHYDLGLVATIVKLTSTKSKQCLTSLGDAILRALRWTTSW